MPFIHVPGLPGKVYTPEAPAAPRKKHPCADCFSCQDCADSRCRVCRCTAGRQQKGALPDPSVDRNCCRWGRGKK
jgi:hypothetical protein